MNTDETKKGATTLQHNAVVAQEKREEGGLKKNLQICGPERDLEEFRDGRGQETKREIRVNANIEMKNPP